MRIHIAALGRDRVLGDKWPQIHDAIRIREMEPGPQKQLARRLWKKGVRKRIRKRFDQAKQMNKGGFWEVPGWVMTGIRYSKARHEMVERLDGSIIKVVSRGLAGTDPQYVDRVVYMVREPGSVATSQEDIHRAFDRGDDAKVNSPKDYNLETYMAARWFIDNPQIPVLVVDSDDLVREPLPVLMRIAAFEGEPAIEDQGHLIKPNQVRSFPKIKDEDAAIWEDANRTHAMLLAGDFQGIVDLYEKEHTATKDKVARWRCFRRGDMVNKHMCELCITDTDVMRNFRRFADSRSVNWRDEPCAYLSTQCDESQRQTVELTISANHWVDGTERSRGLGDSVHKLARKLGFKKPCKGCEKRRDALNKAVPYKPPKLARVGCG